MSDQLDSTPVARAALRRLLMPTSHRGAWAELGTESRATPPEADSAAAILANVANALLVLARMVAPRVQNSEYAAIIGDDTSGRLPTLVLREAFNRDLIRRGLAPLPVIFWRTDLEPDDGMEQQLEARMPGLEAVGAVSHRVLVVTDFMQSGRHMQRATEMLAARGIAADVASLGGSSRVSLPLDVRVYHGWVQDLRVGGLYQNSALSGLTRGRQSEGPVHHSPEIRRSVAGARWAASQVAADIALSLS